MSGNTSILTSRKINDLSFQSSLNRLRKAYLRKY